MEQDKDNFLKEIFERAWPSILNSCYKFGSKNPKHNGIICNGYDLNTDKYARMLKLDLSFLINANKLFKEKLFVKQAKFFNLLAGNDVLKQQIINGISEDDIRETWQGKLNNYKLMRVQYLLYSE